MKTSTKIILGIISIIVATLVIGIIYVQKISSRAIPDYNQTIKLKNMIAEVEVYRDEFAIPHIYAKNETDLYRATGYLMAQDRLWQMDLLRRATTGKLSEIFGKDFIDVDLMLRSLQMTKKSKQIIKNTDPEILEILNAYIDGINQYMEANKDNLPPEFTILGYKPEKWEAYHSINLIGYMSWDLTTAWKTEILYHKLKNKLSESKFKELIPDIDNTTPVFPDFSLDSIHTEIQDDLLSANSKLISLGVTIFSASNNWAVSGKKSTTGAPILANDMHLGYNIPGVWYQMHQYVDNKLNVTGVALPGQPFVVCGHNNDVAWGMTNVMLDDMDFYIETINPDNPNQYKFNGAWKDFQIIEEKIKLDNDETIVKQQKYTHRGPVISSFKDYNDATISMRWIGNEMSNEIKGIYLFNRAKNWEDFKRAVKQFKSVSQNIIYADINGNIGLYTAAGIPIREGSGFMVFNGETDKNDWKGLVPFDSLPYSYNPEKQYVSSANNKTVSDDYPYYISKWFYQPYRIDRINEMLESKNKLSPEDFKQMHADMKSKMVEGLLPDIVMEISKMNKMTNLEKQALETLSKWDAVLSKESIAASIFENFYVIFAKNIIYDEMGEELYKEFFKDKKLVNNLIEYVIKHKKTDWYDNTLTNNKIETITDIVHQSFKETINLLKENHGIDINQWQWGKMHTLTLSHPIGKVKLIDRVFELNRGPYPVGGSNHTVCPYSYSYNNLYHTTAGASHRHIYITNDWDASQTIIPTGISGIPASEHYCDQTEKFINNQYHTDYFSNKKNIIESAKYKMTIEP